MVSTIVSGHYQGLSMAKRRQRRFWDDDEKRRIVAQTQVPGVSVSQVARRYDVNANLVFKWLRDPRFCPVDEDVELFLPVEVGRSGLSFDRPATDNPTDGGIAAQTIGVVCVFIAAKASKHRLMESEPHDSLQCRIEER